MKQEYTEDEFLTQKFEYEFTIGENRLLWKTQIKG